MQKRPSIAVILAAGIGSRLSPITKKKPKCLVRLYNESILDRQIKSLKKAGIKKIIIVTGYKSKMIIEKYRHEDCLMFIENKDYMETNNMYSLSLAEKYILGNSFILCNGDIVFESNIIKDVIKNNYPDFILCEKNAFDSESMKITVGNSLFITRISKSIKKNEAYGCSIDIYKFSEESSLQLFDDIKKRIFNNNDRNDWTEVSIDQLCKQKLLKMKPYNINKTKWVEIDNYNDLSNADLKFSSILPLNRFKNFFIDLDGTLYRGGILFKGTLKFIDKLKKHKKNIFIISNNSSLSKKDYVEKLDNLGIKISKNEIILSTDGLIEYLLKKEKIKIFLLGTESLKSELVSAGFIFDDLTPDFVVLGYDTELNYKKLKQASSLLNNGVKLLMTHPDITCPSDDGPIPDAGAILALLEKTTNCVPYKIFGKPNPLMIEQYISKHKLKKNESVLIGDRLYTDFELAKNVGIDFICVLSGETNRNDIEFHISSPNLIVQSIDILNNVFI